MECRDENNNFFIIIYFLNHKSENERRRIGILDIPRATAGYVMWTACLEQSCPRQCFPAWSSREYSTPIGSNRTQFYGSKQRRRSTVSYCSLNDTRLSRFSNPKLTHTVTFSSWGGSSSDYLNRVAEGSGNVDPQGNFSIEGKATSLYR